MAEGAILIAVESAMFDFEGRRVFTVAGRTTAREGHPVLKGREKLFGPLAVDFEMPQPKGAAQPKPAGQPPPRAAAARTAAKGAGGA